MARVVPAASPALRISCTIGEKMWQGALGSAAIDFGSGLPHEFRRRSSTWCGIAELVDRRNGGELVTAADQNLRIAGERCRIARHCNDHDRHRAGEFARLRLGALARRIEQRRRRKILSSPAMNGRRKRSRVWASIGLSPDAVAAARSQGL